MQFRTVAWMLCLVSAGSLAACKVQKTQEGKVELPKYQVQKTQSGGVTLPKYSVQTPKIEVRKKERTMTVPTVRKEERTIGIPTGISVEPAGSDQGGNKQ